MARGRATPPMRGARPRPSGVRLSSVAATSCHLLKSVRRYSPGRLRQSEMGDVKD